MSFICQAPGTDDRNTLNALWGKLGSEILMQNWETALEDLNRLKDVIESNVSASLLQMRNYISSCQYYIFAFRRNKNFCRHVSSFERGVVQTAFDVQLLLVYQSFNSHAKSKVALMMFKRRLMISITETKTKNMKWHKFF